MRKVRQTGRNWYVSPYPGVSSRDWYSRFWAQPTIGILMTTNPLLDLLFPRLCAVCGSRLQSNETHLCLHCLRHLPRTDFHKENEHAMEQLFRGKTDIDRAFAFFYSTPHSEYRSLLHHIKYHDGKECARYLGKLYAEELCETGLLDNIDLIIPVPLHRTRMRKRGYNQSEWIALGISDMTGIALDTHSLIRGKANPSTNPSFSLRTMAQHPRYIFTLPRSRLHRQTHTPRRRHRYNRCNPAGLCQTLRTAQPRNISLLALSFAQ